MPMHLIYPYPESKGEWDIDWDNPEEVWTYEEATAEGGYIEEYDNSRFIAEMRLNLPSMTCRVNEIHKAGRYNSLEKILVREYEEALKLVLDKHFVS